jgi:hypothetical protein
MPFYNNGDGTGGGGGAPSGVEIIESLKEVDTSGLQYLRPDISGFNPADYLDQMVAELKCLWSTWTMIVNFLDIFQSCDHNTSDEWGA